MKYFLLAIAGFAVFFFYRMWKRRPQIIIDEVDWLAKTARGEAKASVGVGFTTSTSGATNGTNYRIENGWLQVGSIYRISIFNKKGTLVERADIDFNKKEIIRNIEAQGDTTSPFDIVFKR